MYLANFKDDEKNKWFLGNCSKDGVFIDECLVYDFKTEKYFMVEKYNNDIGKSGMFFCAYQNVKKGELGILDDELFIRSNIDYINQERLVYKYYIARGKIGRASINADFNGNYKISVMNKFIGTYGVTFNNNTFNFYYEDTFKGKFERPILKESDAFKFKTGQFFMMDFNPKMQVKTLNGRLDNRFSTINGQHIVYNEIFGFAYERTEPTNVYKIEEGISKYIGEYVGNNRSGLGCFKDPNDNYYLGRWYKNLFNGNGVIDTKNKASFGFFEDGKQNGLFFELFEDFMHIVRFEKGSFKYPFYRLYYDSLQFEKIDSGNVVVSRFSYPFEIHRTVEEKTTAQKGAQSNLSQTQTARAQTQTNKEEQTNAPAKVENNASVATKTANVAQKTSQKAEIVEEKPVYKREDYSSGCYYEGYFFKGKRNGKGSCFWNDGSKYFGDWVDGDRCGQGKFTFANGDYYEGGFKNNNMHGEGTYYYASGAKKTGVWENGNFLKEIITKSTFEFIYKKEEYSNGYYEGYFLHGKRNGRGTFYWNNGAKYEGEWSGDLRKGRGKLTFANGDYYEGSFKNDNYEGQGTYYYADGTKKTGVWQNGVCISESTSDNAQNKQIEEEKLAKLCSHKSANKAINGTKPQEKTKREGTKKVDIANAQGSNNSADINSEEFKRAMQIFSYKVKEGGEVVITSCKNPPKNIIIPEGVTQIFTNAFHNNKPENIESVVIPSTLTKIGAGAFWKCVNLKSINVGENVTEIGRLAFCESGLTDVYIPDSVKNVGEMAFCFFDESKTVKISINEKCKLKGKVFTDNCIITKRK